MSSMRFAYITDTHLGCNEHGHQMQSRYLGHDAVLFDGLGQWISDNDVAFVIHGGDMTDNGTQEEIDHTNAMCERLNVPVYVSLGNHDLIHPDSMERWRNSGRTSHGAYLPDGQDCFAVDAGSVTVVVISHHWNPQHDHQWIMDQSQAARIDQRQENTLNQLMREANRPVIAASHMVLNPISAQQRNTEEPLYPPPSEYLTSWQRIAASNPNLRLALCGHNHTTTRHDHGSFISCTTGSYIERPAQVRLITTSPEAITVETHSLADTLGLPSELKPEQAWSVGPQDCRAFTIKL